MTASRFATDTAVDHLADGRYRGHVAAGWEVAHEANPNGGYVMAIASRAMRSAIDLPDPICITAHFLRPTAPGPVEIDVEVAREGRRHATVAARLLQHGKERIRLLGTFADLPMLEGPTRVDRVPPPFPPVADCLDVSAQARARAVTEGHAANPIVLQFDHRIPHALTGWKDGDPTGRGEMGGYLRWADGADMDSLGLLVVADGYPPSVRNTGDGWGLGWVPTVTLEVEVRKRPAPGYLAASFTTRALTNGYMEEDGEIWDAEGDLVALTRQFAMVSA